MSKYSDKTFEKILDDICKRVKECSTMKGFLINPHIKSVEDVVVNKHEEKLNISCAVNTKYGDLYIKI